MKLLNNKLNQLIMTAALSLSISSAFANHPLQIEAKSTDEASFSNVKATLKNESINISGDIKRNKSDHLIIPGNVKLELLDENDKILKTVTTAQKRHKHRVNNIYTFNKKIPVSS
ncbi:MAG: hypothetical protein ACC657_03925, partial [Thiohalomonadales bacterium]